MCLARASLAQRFPASSVLAREGAGCGSVGDVPGAWLASAPLFPSLCTYDPCLLAEGLGACMLSCFQLFVTPWTVAARLLCPWDSPDKNTGVDCHDLLQGILGRTERAARVAELQLCAQAR